MASQDNAQLQLPNAQTTFIESIKFIPIYTVYFVFGTVFILLNAAAFFKFWVFPFISKSRLKPLPTITINHL